MIPRRQHIDTALKEIFHNLSGYAEACGGVFTIGNRTVTKPQLEAEFAQIATMAERDQPVVRIRGDATLPYQKIIDVMSIAKAKGLTKVGLDTEIR
ncbi:MAG: biopolymer transporter ExbD [bacterium]